MANKRTLWLALGTVALAVVPLFIGGEFSGTDDQATAAIEAAKPGYQPWFTPLWEPPSGEVESLLFALQAALGALVIGYVIGRRHERAKAEAEAETPTRRVTDAA
jgi:cobalt/nickel transport protein